MLLLIVAGFEHRQLASPEVPAPLCLAGLGLTAAGYAITVWAMSVNRFFSPVVRIQNERGHRVVDSGPYSVIRHPGYAGVIFYAAGSALALGSIRAFAVVAAVVLIVLLRTWLEDRTLRVELPGYADYTRRVRSRLLPGIW